MSDIVVTETGNTRRLAVACHGMVADYRKSLERRLVRAGYKRYVSCEAIPRQERICAVEMMIEPEVVLIDIVWKWIGGQKIVRRRQAGCRQRERLAIQNSLSNRIDTIGRNDTANERWTSATFRILQRVRQ